MSELVPPKQAAKLQNALLDYLTTTFALSDADAQRALDEFLRDPDEGIFKGPYLRTRMPFAPAPRYSADELEWMPENFTPYGHQARAFTRLNSALGRPRPTLVTTGTGSGKTEAFLLPVLDHVIRARRNGVTGVKGLILYPMNALANDQAQRLAHLISTDKQLAEVTAAIYTGENGATRTIVSKDGLITDRTVIRDDAPDILLTNYKMLDQLLLRHEDQHIWQQSAESLQYLVLDEFHTYDGAQGTDVAMLLRRLGLALKSYWPERGSKADTHTTEEWDRPLGKITPVGTSATLGTTPDISKTANQSSSGERSGDMAAFATTVFGEPFDTSCVVTEFRKTIDEWAGDAQKRLWDREIEPRTINALIVNDLVNAVTHRPSDEVCATLLTSLYEGAEGLTDRDDLVLLAKGHPFIRQFLEATTEAIHVRDLADRLLPGTSHENDPRVTFLLELLGALGHLRALPDRDMPSTETHLWIRELSRIDRDVSTATHFRWSDDGTVLGQTTDDGTEPEVVALPAVYCRRCGRSGWGVQLASTGNNLSENNDSIRRTHAAHDGRFRALLSAPREGASAVDTGEATASLRWFDTVNRCLDHHIPDADSPKYRNGVLLPVLTQVGNDADEDAKDDVCPSCGAKDAIRFQGAAIATLLSVCLSTLFGSDDFDEKKALVFTDSVQDAAHRAGFISSRSHALTLRTILRGAIGEEYATIPQLIQGVLDQAGDDQFKRYRLLPTELAEQKNFRDFWRSARYRKVPKKTLSQVRNRVAFDAILELGLQSRYGRTLEQTGSICVEVNAGTPRPNGCHRSQRPGTQRGRLSRYPGKPHRRPGGVLGPWDSRAHPHPGWYQPSVAAHLPGRRRCAVAPVGRPQRTRDARLPVHPFRPSFPTRRWPARPAPAARQCHRRPELVRPVDWTGSWRVCWSWGPVGEVAAGVPAPRQRPGRDSDQGAGDRLRDTQREDHGAGDPRRRIARLHHLTALRPVSGGTSGQPRHRASAHRRAVSQRELQRALDPRADGAGQLLSHLLQCWGPAPHRRPRAYLDAHGQATAEVREWIQGRLRGPLGSKRPRRHAHP